MATRDISFQLYRADLVTPARGSIMATPTRRHNSGTLTVLPTAVQIAVNGVTVRALEVPGADWCWEFRERVNGGATRYCTFPAGSVINYQDLADIDPLTFEPTPESLAGWEAAIDTVSALVASTAALDLTGATSTGRALLRATDADEARDAIGAASASGASKTLVAGANIVFTDAADLTVSAQVGEQGLFSSIPRYSVRDASIATTNSVLRLSYRRATRSGPVTMIRTRTGTTAAAATPTVCKMGIFSVAANGDLTRLARTANDTTLFATISTAYELALDATVNIVAGQLYAFALVVVSAAATPTLHGVIQLSAAEAGLPDRLCGTVPGQTDIISSIGFASVADSTANPYLAVR